MEYVLRAAAVLIGALMILVTIVEHIDGQEIRLGAVGIRVVIVVVLLIYGIGGPRLLERLGLGGPTK